MIRDILLFMITPDFNSLTRAEQYFYSDRWPDFLFVNRYPVLGILWNIFLLLIPFFLCLVLIKYWKKNGFNKIYQKIIAGFTWFLWLLFIPNTAYIITDVRHISGYCDDTSIYRVCPENAWMIIFFFIYAIVGWVGVVYLLRQMKKFIKDIKGSLTSNIFIVLIIPLISLGVLLGLINRWNSWEFFLNPQDIFNSIKLYFTNFIYFKNFVIFTLGFYVLYFVGDKLFKKIND